MIDTMNGDRRRFLEFLGYSVASLACPSGLLLAAAKKGKAKAVGAASLLPIQPTDRDELVLSPGLQADFVVGWGDVINAQGETFGYNNDFLAFVQPPQWPKDKAILWVNHESVQPLFVSGFNPGQTRTKEQVIKEQEAVGGSILAVQKTKDGRWQVLANNPVNRRISARTSIPFALGQAIAGTTTAIGTLGNCAGGVTPWHTFLTCEENYDLFYGEVSFDDKGQRGEVMRVAEDLGWSTFFPYPPEHYGWVVEVEPLTGHAKKLTALGRLAHESATVCKAKDGRAVVYMGDDARGECFYKFISDSHSSLEKGTLYVADTVKGQWLPLDIRQQPVLAKRFKDQTELLISTRVAAHLLGGTPLDRPEDVEIHPQTGDVFVTLTNNAKVGNHFGSIMKLVEKDGDHGAMSFAASTFLTGGPETGFACPDNLVFDRHGDLWMTSDISETAMNRDPYKVFGNNGLFYIPMTGPEAGKVKQVASAPVDAEFTGPVFTPDGKTLMVSVQHPGLRTSSLAQPTSRWSHRQDGTPRSAVVAIRGEALRQGRA